MRRIEKRRSIVVLKVEQGGGFTQREILHRTQPRHNTYINVYRNLVSNHHCAIIWICCTHLGGEFAGEDWGEIENMDTNLSMKLPS